MSRDETNLRDPEVWREHFWKRVQETESGCWLWLGERNEDGYGKVTRWTGQRWANYRAHRVAWELANGRPPGAGLVVRHLCHNRPCCNPAHLAEGTHRDNAADMIAAGRFAKGSAAGRAILTEEDAVAIRQAHSQGCSITAIASETGVPRQTVWNVVRRNSWKHVP